jgi:hypothetical protein
MLVTVCAWCERFLGLRETADGGSTLSHGICRACATRHQWAEPPTLVLCRQRADLQRVFQELLRGVPEIRIVVDRREGERRKQAPAGAGDERRATPRRRATPAIVC